MRTSLIKTVAALFVEEQLEEQEPVNILPGLKKEDQGLSSPFSKLAQRVAELAWYQHLFLFTTVVAAGATLGFFLKAILLSAIAAGAFYLACVGLLRAHQHYEKARLESMVERTAKTEKLLNKAIEAVHERGDDLQELASDLQEAGQAIEISNLHCVEQAQYLEEQTQTTRAINQQIHQTYLSFEESKAQIEDRNTEINQYVTTIHSQLADNIAQLNQTDQALAKSSLAIQASTVAAATMQELLHQQRSKLDSILENLKENTSSELALVERLEQSSERLWENAKQRDIDIQERLKVARETQVRVEELVKEIPENRRQAEEDDKRRKAFSRKFEEDERQFQLDLANLMNRSGQARQSEIAEYRRGS